MTDFFCPAGFKHGFPNNGHGRNDHGGGTGKGFQGGVGVNGANEIEADGNAYGRGGQGNQFRHK